MVVVVGVRGVSSAFELDEIVDTENGHGGLSGELDALDLALGGLEHASFDVVARLALGEIESEKGELSAHPLYSTRALGRRELEAGPRRLESMIVSRQSMPSQYRWATCELGS